MKFTSYSYHEGHYYIYKENHDFTYDLWIVGGDGQVGFSESLDLNDENHVGLFHNASAMNRYIHDFIARKEA